MKLFTLGLLLSLSALAQAAPFIVSDPYAASAIQPSEFRLKLDGSATEVVSPWVADLAGLKYFKYDGGPLSNGSHTIVVKACNAAECSADSPPFPFVRGAPAVPVNLRLVP